MHLVECGAELDEPDDGNDRERPCAKGVRRGGARTSLSGGIRRGAIQAARFRVRSALTVLRLPRPAPPRTSTPCSRSSRRPRRGSFGIPPLQDMPFHVAAMRVIHSFGDPAFGLEKYFDLTFGRTQYFLYYVIGSVVAYFTGIRAANVVLLCVYLGGTPLAVRSLCKAIGKDERLAIFTLPLLANVMFAYGFLPFVFGIPLLFWALAAAVRYLNELEGDRDRQKLRREGILLAVLSFVLFFSHIFPFALFGLGFAVLFPWQRPRDWVRAGLPTVPSLLALGWWYFFTSREDRARPGRRPRHAPAADLVPRPSTRRSVTFRVVGKSSGTQRRGLVRGVRVRRLLALGLSQGDRSSARREARLLVVPPAGVPAPISSSPGAAGRCGSSRERFPCCSSSRSSRCCASRGRGSARGSRRRRRSPSGSGRS